MLYRYTMVLLRITEKGIKEFTEYQMEDSVYTLLQRFLYRRISDKAFDDFTDYVFTSSPFYSIKTKNEAVEKFNNLISPWFVSKIIEENRIIYEH